jgi:hypothetical protein
LVYPNPAEERLVYVVPDSGLNDCTVEIYTLQGTKVWSEQRAILGGAENPIQVSQLPSGVYMLRIHSPDMQPVTRKWVKR